MDCSANGDADCAGVGGECGFAGHRDWRLPNYKELTSILNLENFNPAVSEAFNDNCAANCTATQCSCTATAFLFDYWSSTTSAGNSVIAWFVSFFSGFVIAADKSSSLLFVRGVRGGLDGD